MHQVVNQTLSQSNVLLIQFVDIIDEPLHEKEEGLSQSNNKRNTIT